MKFIMEALISEVKRIFKAELDKFHERVEQSFEQPLNPPTRCRRERLPRRGVCVEEDEYDGNGFEDENDHDSVVGDRRYGGRHRKARNQEDNNLRNIKMKIPSFQGKNDPEAYLERERKVELIFDGHNYFDNKKVKLAAIGFSDYVTVWWDQLVFNMRRNREPVVETWEEMKRVMRKRFVSAYYYRELYNKLQNLRQGNRSVKEYYKEMKVAMTRANIEEDREATMARFLVGLNRQIQNVVELQHYVELEDMVHMAIKIENQVKRRDNTNTCSEPNPISSTWKSNQWRKEDKPPNTKPKIEQEQEVTRQGNQDHESNCDSWPSLGDANDEEYAPQGELFVARRTLSLQAKEEEEVQRENIFHTRCHVQNKVCIVIIDSGSCTNVASTTLVEKLGLPTSKHPRPYKLQWLNDSGELWVQKQLLLSFSIGKYHDKVLCNVVPMYASHILLGRPWQFNRRGNHDKFKNHFSFMKDKKLITLVPSTPKQLYEDEVRFKQEHD